MNLIEELRFFIKPNNLDFLSVSQSLAILNSDIEASRKRFPGLNMEMSQKMEDKLSEAFRLKRSDVENSLAFIQSKEYLINSVYPYIVK